MNRTLVGVVFFAVGLFAVVMGIVAQSVQINRLQARVAVQEDAILQLRQSAARQGADTTGMLGFVFGKMGDLQRADADQSDAIKALDIREQAHWRTANGWAR